MSTDTDISISAPLRSEESCLSRSFVSGMLFMLPVGLLVPLLIFHVVQEPTTRQNRQSVPNLYLSKEPLTTLHIACGNCRAAARRYTWGGAGFDFSEYLSARDVDKTFSRVRVNAWGCSFPP